jgi:hypothetical protein
MDYESRPLITGSDSSAPPLDPHIAAVFGHFRPARYDHIRPATRCTILRHPVDTLISIYFFWKTCPRHANPVHDKFLAESPTLESFAKYEGIRRLMSQTYFGGYDIRQFDFVGFYEHLDEDLDSLGTLLGMDLDPKFHANKTETGWAERDQIFADRKRLRTVESYLEDDIAFYEAALARRNR